jgi:hypothetical protein
MLPEIKWVNRYSDTNEPDKFGRWARDLICVGLRFGTVSRCTNEDKVWFTARTYFPMNDGNSPCRFEDYVTAFTAMNHLERMWLPEFLHKIDYEFSKQQHQMMERNGKFYVVSRKDHNDLQSLYPTSPDEAEEYEKFAQEVLKNATEHNYPYDNI